METVLTMESVLEVCRLCLEPLAGDASSPIDDPDLKAKMEQVFNFPIEPKPDFSSQVCIICTTMVSEFYDYSDQVWQNQNRLPLEKVKCEALILKEEPILDDQEDTKQELILIEQGDDTVEAFGEDNVSDVAPEDVVVPKDEQTLEKSEDEGEEEIEQDVSIDEIFLDDYQPPAGQSKRIAARTMSKRKPSVDEDFEDADDNDYKVPEKKRKRINRKTQEECDEEYRQIYEFYEIVCDLCGYKAPEFPLLKEHFKAEHGQTGYLVCCEKKLFDRKMLFEHMIPHVNPDMFRCEICNKSFKRKDYLLDHNISKHSKEEDRPFKCDQCHLSFNKDYKLKTHKLTHEKTHCNICGKECANRYSLKAHIVNMHSEAPRRLVCDTCGRDFRDKTTFERHVNKHAGIDTVEKFQCPICSTWIRGKQGLQKHILHVHEESEKTFICNICGKQSPSSHALLLHKKKVHCELKYECEFCDAKFKQPQNLKEHRAIHTGEVLYSCEYCEKTTNSRANLYVHIKKSHSVQWALKKEQGKQLV